MICSMTVTVPVVECSVVMKIFVFCIHVVVVLIRYITGIREGLHIISVTD